MPNKKKVEIYGLFAALFAKEPTLDLLRHFQEEDKRKLFRAYGFDLLTELRHKAPDQQVEALAVEYTRLFITPAKSTSPRESLQRGEGRLWGSSTVEVNEIYKKFGFELDNSFKDTPDHLSAELAFLAELSKLESEYEDKGLRKAKAGVLKIKKYFLKNHILNWFGRFKDEVIKSAEVSYYKDIVCLLGMVLDDELDNLRHIKEVTDV